MREPPERGRLVRVILEDLLVRVIVRGAGVFDITQEPEMVDTLTDAEGFARKTPVLARDELFAVAPPRLLVGETDHMADSRSDGCHQALTLRAHLVVLEVVAAPARGFVADRCQWRGGAARRSQSCRRQTGARCRKAGRAVRILLVRLCIRIHFCGVGRGLSGPSLRDHHVAGGRPTGHNAVMANAECRLVFRRCCRAGNSLAPVFAGAIAGHQQRRGRLDRWRPFAGSHGLARGALRLRHFIMTRHYC